MIRHLYWVALSFSLCGSTVFGQDVTNAVKSSEPGLEPMSPAQKLERLKEQSKTRADAQKEYFELAKSRPLRDLGLDLIEADPVLRSQLGLAADQGLVVLELKVGGYADQAGLKAKDLITELNGQAITSLKQAVATISKVGKGAIQVGLIREGQPRQLELVGPEHGKLDVNYWIGVPVAPVDETLRSHLPMLPANGGLIATDVVPNSPADKGGVQKNDILMKFDDRILTNQAGLINQIQKSADKKTELVVLRAGKTINLSLTPEARADSSSFKIDDQAVGKVVEDLVNGHLDAKQYQAGSSGKLPMEIEVHYNSLPKLPNGYTPYSYSIFRPQQSAYPDQAGKTDDIAKNPYKVDSLPGWTMTPDQWKSIQGLSQLANGPTAIPGLQQFGPSSLFQQELKKLEKQMAGVQNSLDAINQKLEASKDLPGREMIPLQKR